MNIQIYFTKKNFDVQKAERYFKERRIPIQWMDLQKRSPGEKEIQLMLRIIGSGQLIDRENKKVKEHPACYYDRDSMLVPAIMESPWLLKCPIVRNGEKMTVGYHPEIWEKWV